MSYQHLARATHVRGFFSAPPTTPRPNATMPARSIHFVDVETRLAEEAERHTESIRALQAWAESQAAGEAPGPAWPWKPRRRRFH